MRRFLGKLPRIVGPAAWARWLGFVVLFAILSLRVWDPVFVSTIRNQIFDVYQRVHNRPYTPGPVAIIDIDEASLAAYGQWPWPRTRLADLVERLTQNGAVVIGFDMVFAEPDRLSPKRIAAENASLPEVARAALLSMPDSEEIFAKAIAASRVVLGETAARGGSVAQTAQVAEVPHAVLGADPSPWIASFSTLVANQPVLSAAAAGFGVFSVEPDADGVYRRLPLVMKVQDRFRLALSMEMLRIATGGRAFAVRSDDAGVSAVVVGGVSIDTDPRARVWPWFTKSRGDRYISAGEVLSGKAGIDKLRGKIVLVGTSAVGLEDYRATPVEAAMPGVEIHAQIIENTLAGQFLKRPNYALGMEVMLILAIGLAIIWLVPRIGANWSTVAAAIFFAALAGGSAYAFAWHRLLLDASYPMAATLAVFVTMATSNYMREEAQRRQIRSAFGQYLSPALVEQLSGHPERLQLGGETRELSVLFTDVRGFTTISESYKKNPQGLTRLMNRFLTVMSDPILEQLGTIDKYMGDAIMAFWNAPVDAPDHARRACLAALAMLANVRKLNGERRIEIEQGDGEETYHEINIGIGINSGQCVVGNMGSQLRFDYTALGDTVNLASRLEGQSKPFGVKVILGQSTAKAVADEMAIIEIELVRVKGKKEPERMYALLGDAEFRRREEFVALKAMNASMLACYRGQDWESALTALGHIVELGEKLDIDFGEYAFVYETRIGEFRANPPGKNWEAIYDATEK